MNKPKTLYFIIGLVILAVVGGVVSFARVAKTNTYGKSNLSTSDVNRLYKCS